MIKGARKYLTEEEASLSQEELSKRIAEEKKLPPASVYDSCDVLDQMLKKGPYKTKVYVEGGSNYGAHYTYNTGHYEETYDEYNTLLISAIGGCLRHHSTSNLRSHGKQNEVKTEAEAKIIDTELKEREVADKKKSRWFG